MLLFIFSERTNYGEYVRLIVANSKEEAYDYSNEHYPSLKELGWDKEPFETLNTDINKPTIVFNGGGE